MTATTGQFTFTPPSPIPLAANTRYWIVVDSNDTGPVTGSTPAWDDANSSTTPGTGVAGEFTFSGGSSNGSNNTSDNVFIMQVNAATTSSGPPPATPAPASLVLMITALGLGGLYLLRRRIPNPL